VQETYRQEKRGRPGKDTRYRKHTSTSFSIELAVNTEIVGYDAATDGCFPLITNDRHLTDAQVLAAYRYQPNLEKRHHQLKSVHDAAPVLLKSPERIEALFCCHFIALLCCCLIERELRQAMAREKITELPLFPEQRACKAPTAARTLELFSGLARHRLYSDGRHLKDFAPELTPLHTQVLKLLSVPTAAYTR
jgi:transposase